MSENCRCYDCTPRFADGSFVSSIPMGPQSQMSQTGEASPQGASTPGSVLSQIMHGGASTLAPGHSSIPLSASHAAEPTVLGIVGPGGAGAQPAGMMARARTFAATKNGKLVLLLLVLVAVAAYLHHKNQR